MPRKDNKDLFMSFVLNSADQKTEQLKGQTDKYIEQTLRKSEREERRKAVEALSRIKQEIMLEISATASKTREEYRKSVLLEREKLLDEIKSGVLKKIDGFKKTDHYIAFLKTSAAAFSGKKGTLCLSPEDSDKTALFEKDFDHIKIDKTIKYGGLRFESEKCFYDDTLDSRLSAALDDLRNRHKELCL